MASSRNASRERKPEEVLARDADRRLSTDGGRPATREITNHVPENTPRGAITTPIDINDVTGILDQTGENNADPGSERPEDILDPEEMFMTLTEEERKEWEAMMASRSTQLEKSREDHQNWVDSFTRRRMFAYCRIRKIQSGYKERGEMFTKMAAFLNRIASDPKRTGMKLAKKAELEKRNSDPLLTNKDHAKPAKLSKSALRRNETMLGEKSSPQTAENSDTSPPKTEMAENAPETTSTVDTKHSNAKDMANLKLDIDDTSDDSGLGSDSDKLYSQSGKPSFLKVEQLSPGRRAPST